MNATYAGGCACGDIRYEALGEILFSNYCQCRQCQRQTGTGHAAYITLWGASVRVDGQPSYGEAVGEDGTLKRNAFCPSCGSPLFLRLDQMSDVIPLHVGSLDDPSVFTPELAFWTDAAHGWDVLPADLTKFAKLPPSPAANDSQAAAG